ncbi:MAG: tRNA-modifying protein YgfZ [Acidobacteria bacterium]|nr:tRNA-modifying protein YgfZ [Acidobacteriota bacterium]
MSSHPSYDALRSGLAVVARADRGIVCLRGAERLTWLQGLLTNDVLALTPGGRIYSAYLTAQGRMITDAWVVAAEDALLLDVPRSLAATLASRLDGLIFAEDVQVEDGTSSWPVTQVIGVDATVVASGTGVIAAASEYGRPGAAFYGDVDALLTPALRTARDEAVPVTLDDLEVLRVEAGVPRFFADMTDDTIPLEAGIEDRAISFTKGCYVGQELIVRVTQRGGGRVARKLVGLTIETGDGRREALRLAPSEIEGLRSGQAGGGSDQPSVPTGTEARYSIRAGARVVGHLTSLVYSPALARRIALGYVHRDFVEPGTSLEIDLPDGAAAAVVTALPFVPATVTV